MQSCLGIYIEPNIIKYAKVTKDRGNINVDSFGMKFYDKLNETIKQIISETYSYKIPISINISDEIYNYFYMFSLLNKNDLKKAIDTEFESYCADNGINKNAFESRYILVDTIEDREKIKVIYISANKAEISRKVQQFEGTKLNSISPLPIAISNILEINNKDKKENIAIINIEAKTTVTTIVNEKIYEVSIIEEGTQDILDKINAKENSYSKSYEICKSTTIYTSAGKDLQAEDNGYLEDIMPTLYNIIGQVRRILNESLNKIDKLYISGTASSINNIDLYFQEYLTDVDCEILKPYFMKNKSTEVNIKDYIEVNSAIALGLQGLSEGIKEVNFKNNTFLDSLLNSINTEGKGKLNGKVKIHLNLGEKLDKIETNLLRTAASIFIILIVFSVFSILLNNQIKQKFKDAEEVTIDTNKQISAIDSDIGIIKSKSSQYTKMIENLQQLNNKITDKYKNKNAIPNLLNQIMFIIPKNVRLTSIENTNNKHIVIKAEASQYEQLGYLKAKIKTDGILENVVSTSGNKQEDIVKITIEGELP